MTVQQIVRQPQVAANFPHFIFVKRAQRLNNAFILQQPLNAGDAVVMRLDRRGLFRASGFNSVRINRPLPENPMASSKGALR
jgi:hypothetical protein